MQLLFILLIFVYESDLTSSSSKKKKKRKTHAMKLTMSKLISTRRKVEFRRFCKSDVDTEKYTPLDGHFDLLAFWKDHEKFYPRILTLACPARSVLAERTVNVRRTRLAPKNVNALLCIRSFLKEEAWSALLMDEVEDDEV